MDALPTRPKRILVAIHDPAARPPAAVRKAAWLAARSGAQLVLFHCLYHPVVAGEALVTPEQMQVDIEKLVHAHKQRLERVAKRLRATGLDVHVRVRWDTPAHEGIVREVMREGIDLVVAGTHRHPLLASLFLSNTDWQLLRTCPCPVWLVKGSRTLARRPVLVALDPQHAHAKPAALEPRLLQAARVFAGWTGGTLNAAHCYLPPPVVGASGLPEAMVMPPDWLRRAREGAAKALQSAVKPFGLVRTRAKVLLGAPIDALPAEARRLGAGLVVMGAVSRSGLKRLFIGNTAERVLDALGTDVLVVKPEGFRTPVPKRAFIRPVIIPPM